MNGIINELHAQIRQLKYKDGSKYLIQKLQQQVDNWKRQASDKQATNKTC